MAPAAKKTNKTVSFTAEPEDQALLQAVTEIINRQEYSNFSDLCKDALEQFLAGPPAGAESLEPVLQQVAQLQHQITALEQTIANQDVGSLSQLEGQLIQISQQVEQGDSEVLQFLAQLQEQGLSSGSGSGEGFPEHLADQIDQIDEQVSQLAQRAKQSDSHTTEAIAELQQQLAALEQAVLANAGEGTSGRNLDEQISFLAEQVEQLDARTYDALTELKQALTDLRAGVGAASSEPAASDTTKLEAYLKRLTDQLIKRVDQVETKTGDRITALQQQFTQLAETLAERQEAYLNQLTEQLETRQATVPTPSIASVPEPQIQEQPFATTIEAEEEEPPARPGEPDDAELLNRFGSLFGNDF